MLFFLGATSWGAIKQEIPPLRPPREELPASVDHKDPLPWFIGAGVVAVLVAVITWPRTPQKKIVEEPGSQTRRELGAVSPATPSAVSHILRRYLVAALGLPGEGATTEEIASAMAEEPFIAKEVGDFLSACDAAKFAPGSPVVPSNVAERALALLGRIEASRSRAVSAPQP